MGSFLKKDLIVLVRDRAELLVLLFMPLILIAILGFALRGLMEGDTESLHMQVAIVQEDEQQQGIAQFTEDVNSLPLPEEAVVELQTTAEMVNPLRLLENVFNQEEVRQIIDTVNMEKSEADQALKNEEIVAVLTIPEDFTYLSLRKMLLGEGDGSELHLKLDEYASLQANVFHDIVDSFVRSLNFETAVATAMGEDAEALAADQPEIGGVETVSTSEPVTAFQYYTIGMAVMFVLFTAGTIAAKAFVEKQQHVFDRIILSNRHPYVYLAGKAFAGTIIAFAQLVILFSLSALVFRTFSGQSASFWAGMFFISTVLALCIGALSALLTALTVRFNSVAISSVFSGGIVTVMSLAGGSLFPLSGLPEMIGVLGNWTPNGAALSAYLQWMQGREMSALPVQLGKVAGMAVLFLVIGIYIFPRRRSV